MLRALLRPAAIVSHVLVLTVAVACVALGLWQFDRLGQVREVNQRFTERLEAAPVELTEVLAEETDGQLDEAAWEFRRVEVSGTYRPDEEVLQRNREHQARQGFHLLTPLELDTGEVVLVRRGWVPMEHSEPPVAEAAPPAGEVRLEGYLERPVSQPGFGPQDPEEGQLARVFHTDTARLDRQVDGELFAMVLALQTQTPAVTGELPVAVPTPELDEANHLSYALQWFSFALLALVTYAAWWWTRLRRGRTGRDPQPPGGGGGGGGGTSPTPTPDRPPAGVGAGP